MLSDLIVVVNVLIIRHSRSPIRKDDTWDKYKKMHFLGGLMPSTYITMLNHWKPTSPVLSHVPVSPPCPIPTRPCHTSLSCPYMSLSHLPILSQHVPVTPPSPVPTRPCHTSLSYPNTSLSHLPLLSQHVPVTPPCPVPTRPSHTSLSCPNTSLSHLSVLAQHVPVTPPWPIPTRPCHTSLS